MIQNQIRLLYNQCRRLGFYRVFGDLVHEWEDVMSKSTVSLYKGFDEAKARGWYERWRKAVHKWVKKHSDSEYADLVLFLPDLFILCVGLILDPRVPSKIKIALLSAVGYVITPFDIMPEAVMGVLGLIDDAGIVIIALNAVFGTLEMDPDVLEKVLRDYWHGTENPVSLVKALYKFIVTNANKLFGNTMVANQPLLDSSQRPRQPPTTCLYG